MIVHSAVLLKAEVKALQEANKVKKRRERKKKKRIAQGGSLTIQEGEELLQESQRGVERVVEEREVGISRARQSCCSICNNLGHNARTCQHRQELANN